MKTTRRSVRGAKSQTKLVKALAQVEQVEARLEQVKAREEQAKAREEQAKARAEQARAREEQARAQAEKAKARAEVAEHGLEKVLRREPISVTARPAPLRLLKGSHDTSADAAEVRHSLEQLTERQREILRLIAEGQNTKQIAELLKVSPKTVEYHRMRLMGGLKLHDVPGLVRFAIKAGLITPEQ